MSNEQQEQWKPCECWSRTNENLKENGLKLDGGMVCIIFRRNESTKTMNAYDERCLPLERIDGKRLKRSDVKNILISHCPFCGNPYKDPSIGKGGAD